MPPVDFEKVRKIPIASVLHYYKTKVRRRSDTELVAQCPFPSHTSKNHEWTLAISTDKNKWYEHSETCRIACNKPKGGDVIDFTAMMENLTPLDAAKRLAEIFCIGDPTHPPSKPPESPSGNKPLAFELKGVVHEHPLIQERGISAETAKEFGVGFFPGKGSMANRIVFRLMENGHLIGYAGRTTLEVTPENPKWRLPNGLVKSFLYGLERCKPELPLILVEGCWAVLWLYEQGFQSAALLGSTLTAQQETLLSPFKVVRICMDDDEAGHTAAQVIYERLKPTHHVSKSFLKV